MTTRTSAAPDRGEQEGRPPRHTYIIIYKPKGVLGDFPDPEGRPTVRDLVPVPGDLIVAGRLDARSEGLVLLTDDGKVAHRLTHPRYGFDREYLVLVEGKPTLQTLLQLEQGVQLSDGLARAHRVSVIGEGEPGTTWLRVIMREGKKREVRRMLAAVGHPVRRLIRVRYGPLHLGDLKPGEWRFLTREEVETLLRETQARARRAAARRRRSAPPSTKQAPP